MTPRKPKTSRKKQTAGLKPWPKGTSGNPAGRPKSGMALSEILREAGDMTAQGIVPLLKRGSPVRAFIATLPPHVEVKFVAALSVWASIIEGRSQGALGTLLDRLEGKLPDATHPERKLEILGLQEQLKAVYGQDVIRVIVHGDAGETTRHEPADQSGSTQSTSKRITGFQEQLETVYGEKNLTTEGSETNGTR